MLEIMFTVTAFILGMSAIFMAWLTNYQTKTLTRQLDGANNRLGILRQDIEAKQTQSQREITRLRSRITEIHGDPMPVAESEEATAELPAPPPLQEITPQDLKARLEQGNDLLVIDMRQAYEYESGHIPGATQMFVNEIPIRQEELPKDKDIVLQCWYGNTSLQASAYLIDQGWSPARVFSLSGGIAGWTETHGVEGLTKNRTRNI